MCKPILERMGFVGLLVIPTCQHAQLDLVQTGEKVEEEKDRLLENVSTARIFFAYA